MATREASIWRSVIQAHSMAFKPYSPNAIEPPRQALPLRRPRICFLYLTFLGINIAVFSFPYIPRFLIRRYRFRLLLHLLVAFRNIFALIDPALHADNSVRGMGFGSAE